VFLCNFKLPKTLTEAAPTMMKKQEEPHNSTFYSEQEMLGVCIKYLTLIEIFRKIMRPETQMDHNNKRKSKKSSLFGKMKQATARSKKYETFHTVCDSASYQGEGSISQMVPPMLLRIGRPIG